MCCGNGYSTPPKYFDGNLIMAGHQTSFSKCTPTGSCCGENLFGYTGPIQGCFGPFPPGYDCKWDPEKGSGSWKLDGSNYNGLVPVFSSNSSIQSCCPNNPTKARFSENFYTTVYGTYTVGYQPIPYQPVVGTNVCLWDAGSDNQGTRWNLVQANLIPGLTVTLSPSVYYMIGCCLPPQSFNQDCTSVSFPNNFYIGFTNFTPSS